MITPHLADPTRSGMKMKIPRENKEDETQRRAAVGWRVARGRGRGYNAKQITLLLVLVLVGGTSETNE
jgi:hypothetical protein